MFSEKYIVYEKYSLVSHEHVCTCDSMPWKYTYLYDKNYLPHLSEEICDNLNAFFRYQFLHSFETLHDDNKNLVIGHKDGEILSFEISNPIKYGVVNNNIQTWLHFQSTIMADDAWKCKEKIDKMTDITDELVTYILNIEYDKNAKFRSIGICDESYNLGEHYSKKTVLATLNELCSKNKNDIRGIINLYPDSEKLKYKLIFNYPRVGIQINRLPEDQSSPYSEYKVVEYTNKQNVDVYLDILKSYNVLLDDQLEYIKSHLNDKSQIDIEYYFDEEGKIEDIILCKYTVYEFEDLTTS